MMRWKEGSEERDGERILRVGDDWMEQQDEAREKRGEEKGCGASKFTHKEKDQSTLVSRKG
jgi:hypothetical protein